MVILIVEVLISAVLLWFYNKSSILELGLLPTKSRVIDLTFGFVLSSMVCAISMLAIAFITETELIINPEFTFIRFLNSSWWMLKSVLVEELLFRGALLYIAMNKLGVRNACLISSVAFGVYHWFSYNIFGDIGQMIYIFILTGIGGLLFAYSFAVTRSMYLPIALHLGWNLVNVVIFSQGPLGDQLLLYHGGKRLDGFWTIIFFVYQILVLPAITYWYLRKSKSSVSATL